MPKAGGARGGFRYGGDDCFPLDGEGSPADHPLGLVTADTPDACAETTAAEIARLLAEGAIVRDRITGVHRPVTAADIAILFRTRDSHPEFEAALDRRGIGAYVYKGLGFFDADEIKDVLALLWYLADPLSDLRAAALLRSRFFRVSDETLRLLAPDIAAGLAGPDPALGQAHGAPRLSRAGSRIPAPGLDPADASTLAHVREVSAGWRARVDRMPPAELLDFVLAESAYFVEMRGP